MAHPQFIFAISYSILDHNGLFEIVLAIVLKGQLNRCIHSWNTDCNMSTVTRRQMVVIASTD
jgi:hypothetical protein